MSRALGFGRVIFAAILFFLALVAPARAETAVPKFEQRCTDLAGLLTPQEREDLERRLVAYERGTGGAQIAILIVPSLDGEAIEDYSIRVFREWKLGRKDKDDGVLITVARAERRARIEVGKGVEGDLTDLEASQIIRKKMSPFTKSERWHDGLVAALNAIETKIAGQVYGPVDGPARPRGRSSGSALAGVLLGVIFFALMLWLFSRRGGGGGGGGGFFFFGGGYGGGGYGGGGFGGGGGGGGWDPPSGGGGEAGGGGASDDV